MPLLDVNSVDLNHTTVKHVLILHIHGLVSYMLDLIMIHITPYFLE